MLPRRQPSASRARSPHAAPGVVTVRRAIICSLASVFLLGAYVNLTFLMSASSSSSQSSSSKGRFPLANTNNKNNKNQQQQLVNALSFETRAVKHVAFTSGCAEIDVVHSEVLAHSLRATGFAHNVSHLVYGCSVPEYEALQRKKNPQNKVEHLGYPVVKTATTLFGEDKLTTTLHAGVLRQWLTQELNRNRLKDDDFIMLVDSDAVFTKQPDIWNLYREVEDIQDPRWFGQDASWYWPKRLPLPEDELRAVLPADSPALEIKEWRDYAVTAPYAVEVALLRQVLPTVEQIWSKLSTSKKHLAFALAAAHHGVPFGISGVLSVHDYPSRYENWDFVDDIKYNPCNETPRAEDLGLLSFPISLRAENFTLQTWIDGREWSMFHSQLPNDLLHCDAWLLKEPSGKVWELASTTKGYERVPTILRRRHTMSVCLAVRAYNQALIGYKKVLCPYGYNVNKQIPMEFQGKTWPTALAYGGSQTRTTVVEYGNSAKLPKSQQITGTLQAGQERSDDLHFVYVTGCSAEHQWQSDLLAQSFADAKQRGRLTRVVTGCSDEQLTDVIKRSKLYSHLSLFATKSYATKPTEDTKPSDFYEGYNKPFGLRDWLRSANPPVLETAVVIVNGDFVFSTPLTFNSGHRVTTAKDADSRNYKQHSQVIEGFRVYKPFFVYQGERDVSQVNDVVASGVGIAQRWPGSVGLETMVSKICPGCPTVSAQEVQEYYSPGSPTVLTRQDLVKLIDDYCAMTVTTRRMDPTSSIAENVGLAVAAIKHQVKFTAFDNVVITGDDPGGDVSGDFWGFLQFTEKNPCDEATDEPMLLLDGPRMLAGEGVYKAKDEKSGVEWVYDKTLVPSNVFSCDAWLLATPPKTLWLDAKKDRNKEAMRQAYGVCTSLKLLNRAVVAHRERVCIDGFNHQKKLKLVAPRPQSHLKVGAVDTRWDQAMAA